MVGMTGNEYLKRYIELQKKGWSGVRTSKTKRKAKYGGMWYNRYNDETEVLIAMRKNFGAKPWTYPQPVLMIATYGEDGTPDVMNAAWGGISDDIADFYLCQRRSWKRRKNILARKAFTVSMAEAPYVKECDYVGIVSGNKEPDKFAKAGFHAEPSEFVDAPLIKELRMAIECRLVSYDPETCRLLWRNCECQRRRGRSWRGRTT